MISNINDEYWQRPMHFATTITPSLYMNLQNRNFSLNGLSYQVIPRNPAQQWGKHGDGIRQHGE